MGEKAILFDATKCIACRGCQVACKQWNELKAVVTTNFDSLLGCITPQTCHTTGDVLPQQ